MASSVSITDTVYAFFQIPSAAVTVYSCGVLKFRSVPLSGLIVAPGVNVNSGLSSEISVPGPTKIVMELLLIIGLVVMATPGSIQLNMSASALRASSRMHEEETIASSK